MRHLLHALAWGLGLALSATPAGAAASSCFVSQGDAARVSTDSSSQLLARSRVVIFTPCKGQVRGEALWVWFSPEAGQTQGRKVAPPSTLEQAIGQTATVPLNEGKTLWQRLNAALVANDGRQRDSFSRFDSKYGIQLGGLVVPGRDLRLPLAAFRWNANEAVLLKDGAGKVTRLTPVDGRVLLPISRLAVGRYGLVQGGLEASFAVPPEADVVDLRAALHEIESEPADPGVQLLRRSILLSEYGFVLNLVSDYVSD